MTSADPSPLDPDRILALSYVPSARREAVGALWRLDAALGAVLSAGREPMISRIKLAWWRDSLEKLDRERAPAEPVLQAVAQHVLPAGVSGAELAPMEEGWAVLLSDEPLTSSDLDTYARQRGALLFRLGARLLGAEVNAEVEKAGETWALADLARHSGNEEDSGAALKAALERAVPRRWPPQLRPLGMLAVLARRDAESGLGGWQAQGSPGRMVRMLGHRLSGY
ncbi:MAG TPA: squalene/phytoene synthase family protein [Allosphingosinicella sp.]|nr:squalene/phytoene synthase family protein [Allosphingosinicella sp.]